MIANYDPEKCHVCNTSGKISIVDGYTGRKLFEFDPEITQEQAVIIFDLCTKFYQHGHDDGYNKHIDQMNTLLQNKPILTRFR